MLQLTAWTVQATGQGEVGPVESSGFPEVRVELKVRGRVFSKSTRKGWASKGTLEIQRHSIHPHPKYSVTCRSVKDPPERIKRNSVYISHNAQMNALQRGRAESIIFHGALIRELQKVLHQ